jgi:uncharacterized protein YecE (DUF72 family)
MDQNEQTFYSGASGLVLPVPNKQAYPEEFKERTRLCYYGSLFNSIEVNSSFYKLPQAKTMQKWAAEVPENFMFTFKLWKEITHNKGLVFSPPDVDRFMQVIDQVGEKKACLLVQFPPSITIAHSHQFTNLLSTLQEANADQRWKVAIEFRHNSWYQESIYELLEEYGAGMVLQDLPASATPMIEQTAKFVYLRFHGPNGGYRGSYTDSYLYEYAQYIREWQADGKMVYTYFNNTMGEAVKNLMTLNRYVKEDTD